ncbi:MAG TPA: class I SAM-dependent methyltransferase [Candidatus Thermoplasmatota archaeon]|nr:class I SAM-dependent methyltransferase [Candidatus Thermoplasmatota archaeon]
MALLHGDYAPARGWIPPERTRRLVADTVARRAGLFPGDIALVAPCGPGLAAAPLARAFTRCRVVAADADARILERCRANAIALDAADRLRPYLADATALPFEDECFPLVACAFELHARDDALDVLDELLRVAFWSGKLIAVEPDFSRLPNKPAGLARNVFDEDTVGAMKEMGWGKVAVQKIEVLADGTVVQLMSAKRLDGPEGADRDGDVK